MLKEIILLKYFYQFRYLTQSQLVEITGRASHSWLSRELASLAAQELVIKQEGKSAFESSVYCLGKQAPKTIKRYATELGIDLPLARSVSNPRLITRVTKLHLLDIVDAFIHLKNEAKQKGLAFSWESKTQLYGYEPQPKPIPDAFMTLGDNQYFVEVLPEDILRAGLFKRLHQYHQFWESGEWETEVGGDVPKLFIIAQNEKQQYMTKKLLEVIDEDFASDSIIQMISS